MLGREAKAAAGGWEERLDCSLSGCLRRRAEEFLKLLKPSREEVHSTVTAKARWKSHVVMSVLVGSVHSGSSSSF